MNKRNTNERLCSGLTGARTEVKHRARSTEAKRKPIQSIALGEREKSIKSTALREREKINKVNSGERKRQSQTTGATSGAS